MSSVELTPETPVNGLAGVGSDRVAQLERLGLRSVGDLWFHRPRRYEDRRALVSVADLPDGEAVTVRGRVLARRTRRLSRGRRTLTTLEVDDGTGVVQCRWWNMPYAARGVESEAEVYLHGRVRAGRPPTMDHPELEVVDDEEGAGGEVTGIVPVYPLTAGLTQRFLRRLIRGVLPDDPGRDLDPWPGAWAPDWPGWAEAVRQLHLPDSMELAERARRRLALDEFVALQADLARRRRTLVERVGRRSCAAGVPWLARLEAALPFALTAAQLRVLDEIRGELADGAPMRRLLQGDVGSGKTVVAAGAAAMVLGAGFDVAVMAPTELLAEQHGQTFGRWLRPLGVRVRAVRSGAAGDAVEADAGGAVLYVGTHALLSSGFRPRALGLVVIDEQQKFGVAQRDQLVRKGTFPHVLVMTATPIPRTLGLTLYGDLDQSVLDERPGGRGRVRTFRRGTDRLPKVWDFVRDRLAAGEQAYVILPRIEGEPVDESGGGESDANEGAEAADGEGRGVRGMALRSAVREAAMLAEVLAPARVGLVHGRLGADEREAVMAAFRSGEVGVLVATSVIEVGVDVPNATVMVIEHAERFGLAQLHQMRGRIGRGDREGYCILISDDAGEDAVARLEAMVATADGFEIAEADLRIRGPGELLGSRQRGAAGFRFADLVKDRDLLEEARRLVAVDFPRNPGPFGKT